MKDAGVISGMDMTPETAYVKLAWALGQTEDVNEVKDIIQTNVAGELNESSSLKYFLKKETKETKTISLKLLRLKEIGKSLDL